MTRFRFVGVVSGMAAVLALAVLPLSAQEAKEKSAGAPAKRTLDPSRRVPDYFGQLGLTAEQRESIYKIRAKHDEQIRELRRQLAQAQEKMVEECETVLSPTQKELLAQRRKAGAEARKAAAAARAKSKANASSDAGTGKGSN